MNKKLAFGLLFLLIGFEAVAAHAQTQHIIIIVQENRTPDNLFAGNSTLQGEHAEVSTSAQCNGSSTTLQSYARLDACFNPNHDHGPAPIPGVSPGGGFEGAWDPTNSSWDNGCQVPAMRASCYLGSAVAPNYTYIDDSPLLPSILKPYNEIAEQYGFSNWMFQTNQGPSYLAHQFLFSGTSAPVNYNTTYYDYFAAENPTGNSTHSGGCGAPSGTTVTDLWSGFTPTLLQLWPTEYTYFTPSLPSGSPAGFPCYDHHSMADLLDAGSVSWKYYIQDNSVNYANSIWTAPNSLQAICLPLSSGVCNGTEYTSHVVNSTGQILNDINGSCGGTCTNSTCILPEVSWVIPDGAWSDHPGDVGSDGGPSWVAAIVNAIGAQSKGYSGTPSDCGYWGKENNTTILIVWDDWGGWYDHIAPYLPGNGTYSGGYPSPPLAGPTNGDWYVYGFRVPLLVVSAFVNATDSTGGYISGTTSQGGEVPPYVHDFGSILGFIEHTYSLPPYTSGLNTCGIGYLANNSCDFPYADYFAPDTYVNGGCTSGTCPYPLSDFFTVGGTARTFTTITGAKYLPSCFTSASNASTCFGSNFGTDADDE
jgi:phospholipase C